MTSAGFRQAAPLSIPRALRLSWLRSSVRRPSQGRRKPEVLQHHRLRGLAFAVLVVSVVLAGCAADHNARQQASASAAPATTRLGQRQLRHMLLTLAGVQAVRSAPAGLVEQPRSSLYEDPDPRLPCGRTPTFLLSFGADGALLAFPTGGGSDEV